MGISQPSLDLSVAGNWKFWLLQVCGLGLAVGAEESMRKCYYYDQFAYYDS